MNNKTNIIVIDDDERIENHPLLVKLRQLYNNVEILSSPKEGTDYVATHLDQRNIIILDYKFDADRSTGRDVLEKIRQISKLIPVIIWTANGDRLTEIADFVNYKAYAILNKSPYEPVLESVSRADKELNNSLEGAIEEWVLLQDKNELDKPYMINANGKSYSLRDILREVREQTPFGQRIEKDLIMLTIDLLIRNKESLDIK